MYKSLVYLACLLAILFSFVFVPNRVSADGLRGDVVATAIAQVGKPYEWGAMGPNAFDCSGLVHFVYREHGINIPASTFSQWHEMSPLATYLQPGDLVFFDDVHHVGMVIDYNNDGRLDMVHATYPEGVEIVNDLYGSHYAFSISGYRTAFY